MSHTLKLKLRLTGNRRALPAFTLVEVLVATVVGAVLILLVAHMATSGLHSVGLAGGRMISASKMHDLRSQLAADLALVPDPALGILPDRPPLQLEAQAATWTLTLLQPDTTASWKQITYRWLRSRQTLERSEQNLASPRSDSHSQTKPQTLVTGLIDWQVECLPDPAQSTGPRDWSDPSRLPAALLCRATLSSVREEGRPEDQQPAAEKGRDYEWRLSIAAGGGFAP